MKDAKDQRPLAAILLDTIYTLAYYTASPVYIEGLGPGKVCMLPAEAIADLTSRLDDLYRCHDATVGYVAGGTMERVQDDLALLLFGDPAAVPEWLRHVATLITVPVPVPGPRRPKVLQFPQPPPPTA